MKEGGAEQEHRPVRCFGHSHQPGRKPSPGNHAPAERVDDHDGRRAARAAPGRREHEPDPIATRPADGCQCATRADADRGERAHPLQVEEPQRGGARMTTAAREPSGSHAQPSAGSSRRTLRGSGRKELESSRRSLRSPPSSAMASSEGGRSPTPPRIDSPERSISAARTAIATSAALATASRTAAASAPCAGRHAEASAGGRLADPDAARRVKQREAAARAAARTSPHLRSAARAARRRGDRLHLGTSLFLGSVLPQRRLTIAKRALRRPRGRHLSHVLRRPTQQRGRFAAGRLLLPPSGSSSSIPMVSLELAGTNLNRPTTTVTRRLTING